MAFVSALMGAVNRSSHLFLCPQLRVRELTKGVDYYSNRLGLVFERPQQSGALRLVFSLLDADDHDRKFYFSVLVDDQDQYSGEQREGGQTEKCWPLVATLSHALGQFPSASLWCPTFPRSSARSTPQTTFRASCAACVTSLRRLRSPVSVVSIQPSSAHGGRTRSTLALRHYAFLARLAPLANTAAHAKLAAAIPANGKPR